MKKDALASRRDVLKQIGVLGAVGGAAALGLSEQSVSAQGRVAARQVPSTRPVQSSREGFLDELKRRVDSTPLVDSHEHIRDEEGRLKDHKNCIQLFLHYLGDDFVSAGLVKSAVFSDKAMVEDPVVLWRRLEPYWNSVKNTGYARALRISVKELYGIDRIDEAVIPRLQKSFEELAVPGLYDKVLRGHCSIESCQTVHDLYSEMTDPTFILQDIDFRRFQRCAFSNEQVRRVGLSEVVTLSDYHEFIRAWFAKYAIYAVAIKSAIAYRRGLDFEKVPAELVEGIFKRQREKAPITPEEEKKLQDHLFWFCVDQADKYDLPVKLHTGYYAGSNDMPVSRVKRNVAQAADLCLRSPKTRFMFMHTAWPYGQELISVAKQFTNAHVQTCWAWIIDPLGTKEFLKQYIVSAPSSKIHTFGGDYRMVENVVGHARIARGGVYAALAELVEDGYLGREDALELIEPLLRGNARRIFNLEKKYEAAKNVPWNTRVNKVG